MQTLEFKNRMNVNEHQTYVDALLERCYSIIPVKDKKPTVSWKKYQESPPKIGELQYGDDLGLICGRVSQNIEVIDIDAKNAEDSSEFLKIVGKTLFAPCTGLRKENFLIQKTPSGGFHFIYSCDLIERNQVLAKNQKGLPLLETRGEGGFIVIYDLPKLVNGKIPVLSVEQRECLFSLCRSLGQQFEKIEEDSRIPIQTKSNNPTDISPFTAFNSACEIIPFMERYGWKYVSESAGKKFFVRPGKEIGHSASWDGEFFYCFTTSTSLPVGKGLRPAAIYSFLECNGDFKTAALKLANEGYGTKQKSLEASVTQPTKTIQEYWSECLVEQEPEEQVYLLQLNGRAAFTPGNYSMVVGKKKSRKTLFIVYLASMVDSAFIFDTEQGKSHVWRIKCKLLSLSRQHPIFSLRGYDSLTRRHIIEETLRKHTCRPKVAFIDGVRDLLIDINNIQEVHGVISWLERLTNDLNIHICCVLHLNKTDNNARGHLGTELGNKSELIVEVVRKADHSLVKCSDSRDEPFEPFLIRHDENGVPEIYSPKAPLSDAELTEKLNGVLSEGLPYGKTIEQIKTVFNCGQNKAKEELRRMVKSGLIVKIEVGGGYSLYRAA